MLIDISKSINKRTKIYDEDPQFILEKVSNIDLGAEYNVSRIVMGSHMATHIDSPAHFYEKGITADKLDINVICGEAVVISAENDIDADFIKQKANAERLLFKTGGKFGLTESGAEYIAENNILLVGIDSMDIEAENNEGFPVHKKLLGNGIPILECLELKDISDGRYRLICLPLKIDGIDASPVRAVLEEII